jgi:hypothetical protein
MNGVIDQAKPPLLSGWISGVAGIPPTIKIFRGEALIASCIADRTRPDLADKPNSCAFSLQITEGYSLRELVDGSLRLTCGGEHGSVELKLWRPVQAAAALDALTASGIEDALRLLSDDQTRALRRAVSGDVDGPGVVTAYGQVSDDYGAIVGREGQLFLYQGSNRVADLYGRAASERQTNAWADLARSRKLESERRGIDFMQLLLPEKSSALAELCPYKVEPGSATYQQISAAFSSPQTGIAIIDGLKVFRRSPAPQASFRTEDTHLSTFGCELIVREICEWLGTEFAMKPAGVHWEQRTGDLGRRFAGPASDRKEIVPLFSGLAIGNKGLSPSLLASHDPDKGHQGISRTWRSSNAPLRQRVLCFGNSFMERGNSSTTLSWWLSRVFAEFKFVWSAEIDWALVDAFSPDLVIGQTIERFLGRCPAT